MIFVGVGDARWFPWRPVDRLGIVLGGCWRCPVVTWSGRPVRVLAGEVARSSGAGWNLGAASLALRALLAAGGGELPSLLIPWKLCGIGFVPQRARTDHDCRWRIRSVVKLGLFGSAQMGWQRRECAARFGGLMLLPPFTPG